LEEEENKFSEVVTRPQISMEVMAVRRGFTLIELLVVIAIM